MQIKFASVLALALLLSACRPAPRVYKVALVAPFEGHARSLGYAVFPAMRAGLQRAIVDDARGTVQLTFVAYNDNAEPEFAARVSRNVTLDRDVLFVVGHLLPDTTAAALPTYRAAGLPLLARCRPEDSVPGEMWCTLGPIEQDAARAMQWIRDAARTGEVPSRALAARALDATRGK